MDESVSGDPTTNAGGAARGGATDNGAERWLCVHDDLLRGLTHALSNRLGTISAAAYLVELQPAAHVTTAATLRAESERLDGLLQLMRLLPRRADAVAEPVVPTDMLTQAMAISAHHPDAFDLPTTVHTDGDLQPAYVEPGRFTMALCLALGAAQRTAQLVAGREGRVTVRIACSTDRVQLETRGETANGQGGPVDALGVDDVAAIDWLLREAGGGGAMRADGITVFVPTLQAARRARRS